MNVIKNLLKSFKMNMKISIVPTIIPRELEEIPPRMIPK